MDGVAQQWLARGDSGAGEREWLGQHSEFPPPERQVGLPVAVKSGCALSLREVRVLQDLRKQLSMAATVKRLEVVEQHVDTHAIEADVVSADNEIALSGGASEQEDTHEPASSKVVDMLFHLLKLGIHGIIAADMLVLKLEDPILENSLQDLTIFVFVETSPHPFMAPNHLPYGCLQVIRAETTRHPIHPSVVERRFVFQERVDDPEHGLCVGEA